MSNQPQVIKPIVSYISKEPASREATSMSCTPPAKPTAADIRRKLVTALQCRVPS